jgi:hypothetical protein
MKHLVITFAAVSFLSLGFIGGTALSQEPVSSCATSGTALLENIPRAKEQLLPSVARALNGYGRQAKVSNCTVALTCVGNDASEQSREVSRDRCVVVRDQLVRAGVEKSTIEISRENPDGNNKAGAVYLTLR